MKPSRQVGPCDAWERCDIDESEVHEEFTDFYDEGSEYVDTAESVAAVSFATVDTMADVLFLDAIVIVEDGLHQKPSNAVRYSQQKPSDAVTYSEPPSLERIACATAESVEVSEVLDSPVGNGNVDHIEENLKSHLDDRLGELPVYTRAQKIGFVLGPVLALCFGCVDYSDKHVHANEVMAITAFIAVWWVFEVIPLPITSLMPVILMPIFKIETGKVLAGKYFNSTTFLFLGSFLVDLAIEHVNLHKRVALHALLVFGLKPKQLLLGFMIVAGCISMFCSNTSTTIMLVPFANGLLGAHAHSESGRRFQKGLLLGLAYGATCGGLSTLIGTPPNGVFSGLMSEVFPDAPTIAFDAWFLFAFPVSVLMGAAAWAILCVLYCRNLKFELHRDLLQLELQKLGKINRDEVVVGCVLFLQASLWVVRPYAFTPYVGTCSIQPEALSTKASCVLENGKWKAYIDDGVLACLAASLLFFVPSQQHPGKRILTEAAFEKLPWGILILFGSGFAIAHAFKASGLSAVIGGQLGALVSLGDVGMVFCVSLIVVFFTELTSNTATASVLLPILMAVAQDHKKNPLLLCLPVTLSTSMAFMLPVATPPNAVVFATGKLTMLDMMKAGILLNLFGVLCVTSMVFVSGRALGDISTFPSWANATHPSEGDT